MDFGDETAFTRWIGVQYGIVMFMINPTSEGALYGVHINEEDEDHIYINWTKGGWRHVSAVQHSSAPGGWSSFRPEKTSVAVGVGVEDFVKYVKRLGEATNDAE